MFLIAFDAPSHLFMRHLLRIVSLFYGGDRATMDTALEKGTRMKFRQTMPYNRHSGRDLRELCWAVGSSYEPFFRLSIRLLLHSVFGRPVFRRLSRNTRGNKNPAGGGAQTAEPVGQRAA